MSKPTERPIILNVQEVNAVLAGGKTQHRIKAEAEPTDNPDGYYYDGDDGEYAVFSRCVSAGNINLIRVDCPFGQVGDRLWVQEPSLIHCDWDWFYADNTLVECKEPFTSNDLHLPWDDKHQEYKGTVGAEYLPRWASRLLLEITDIRIERVQDITLGDSLKEACNGLMDFAVDYWMVKHGEAAWFTNPWVWVIEFKVIKENDDG